MEFHSLLMDLCGFIIEVSAIDMNDNDIDKTIEGIWKRKTGVENRILSGLFVEN